MPEPEGSVGAVGAIGRVSEEGLVGHHRNRLSLSIVLGVLLAGGCGGGGSNEPDGGTGGDGGGSDSGPGTCSETEDSDGDGVLDCDEEEGWEVIADTDGFGAPEEGYRVQSDPTSADSDGDGLDDMGERTARTDPNDPDTDDDNLTDLEELETHFTSPVDVDTDDDSRGPDGMSTPDPRLWDGGEVELGTSPKLADTDGDDLTDYQEVNVGGRNPLVADVPRFELQFMDGLLVDVIGTFTSSCSTTSEKFSRQLAARDTTDTKSSRLMTRFTMESGTKVHADADLSFDGILPSGKSHQSITSTLNMGLTSEVNASWSSETSTSVREEVKRLQRESCFEESTTTGGVLHMPFRIVNEGAVGFTVSDVVVTAFRYNAADPSALQPLGSATLWEGSPVSVAAGSPTGRMEVAIDVSASTALNLLEDPSGLIFEIGTYTLQDEEGRDLVFLNDVTAERTGVVEIDYGDGRVERFMVATNVARAADGTAAGATLDSVLSILDRGYATDMADDGSRMLTELQTPSGEMAGFEPANAQFWYASGTIDGLDGSTDFGDLVLGPGQVVSLALLKDRDRDGLMDNEEGVHGSDPTVVDSDGDTVPDAEETTSTRRHSLHAEFPGDYVVDVWANTHALAVLSNGTLWSWGLGDQGQLGRPDYDNAIPIRVGNDTDWVTVEGARYSSFGLKEDGTLWSWGSDQFGQLGNGPASTADVPAPQRVGTASNWVDIAAGHYHVLALNSAGELWTWGLATSGQLGTTTTETCTVSGTDRDCATRPTRVGGAADWVDIAASNSSSYGIRGTAAGGDLYAWGSNHFGALGIGSEGGNYASPTRVGSASDWSSVVASGLGGLGVRVSDVGGTPVHALYSWGANMQGQLGRPAPDLCQATIENECALSPGPVDLCGGSCASEIRMAGGPTVQAVVGGELYTWGANHAGSLGLTGSDTCTQWIWHSTAGRLPGNQWECARTPTRLGGDADWRMPAGTGWSRFAIKESCDGTSCDVWGPVYGWGLNRDGTLGQGHFLDREVPEVVPEYPLM